MNNGENLIRKENTSLENVNPVVLCGWITERS